MMGVDACPACTSSQFSAFADFGAVPLSGTFYTAGDAAPDLHPLAFEYCTHCGYIRQTDVYPQRVDYAEVDRATQNQLPSYTGDMLAALRTFLAPTDLVIEVGANDGSFLNLLRATGCERTLAIEPSRTLAAQCAAQGHGVENLHLTQETARAIVARHGGARAVVCRHTLEHVLDPFGLLQAIRLLLAPGARALIEVPDTSVIVDGLFAHELWDEHVSYFSLHSLKALARRAGLRAIESHTLPHRTTRNLLLWAEASHQDNGAQTPAAASWISGCAAFADRWGRYAAAMRAQAERWRAPVVAMGASHPQTNYLLFSGLGTRIDLLLDDDIRKQDRQVAVPRFTPVHGSATLTKHPRREGTLLLSAFGCDAWSRAVADALTPHGFDLVDPMAILRQY